MAATIQNQTFGFEFEFGGMTKIKAAHIIAEHFGTTQYTRGTIAEAFDKQNRKWKVVYDSSVNAQGGEQCEMVTPILNYSDIEDLQEIIRKLRKAGAKVDQSCGIHIHVGADKHDAKSLKNLMNIFYSKQDLIYKALEVLPYREAKYTKKLSSALIHKIGNQKPKTLSTIGDIWYEGYGNRHSKYNSSRYHGLNLHNVWYGQTVEFRLFNSTTHAGKAKAYIQFCLAISAQAINSKSAQSKPTTSTNEKYTFRTWLLRLGLIGDEFKTARTHLLANLEGNTAWRNAQ